METDTMNKPDFVYEAEAEKLRLEALKLEAEIASDAEKAASEVRKNLAEARKLEAEAESAVAMVRRHEIELAVVEEKEAERRADNKFQHIFVFDDVVGDGSVNICIRQLDTWRRIDPGCDITIRFYSPGGSVIAGMYLFDYIEGLKRAGHKVVTEAFGYAASMAGILLQVGDVRRIGRESYILIHEISFGAYGKIGVVEDEVEFVKKIANRVLDIFAAGAKRAKDKGTAKKPLSRAQFKTRWTRKDWWLSSDEALEMGVVDEVI